MSNFTSLGIRHETYWQADVPAPSASIEALPKTVDVLIVGSGYTGLNAAIETARGGRSTLVLDAHDLGYGCSTRNGGQVSTSVKPSLEKLTKSFGAQKARDIRNEGASALEWLADFIGSEAMDCDFHRSGRFHAAHTARHYETLVRDAEKMRRDEAVQSFAVPRAEQHSELGSESYFGGVVFPQHAAVHPAKMHREMLRLATQSGAQAIGHCPVLDIEPSLDGFTVTTANGTVKARNVIVATNGYSTNLMPWLRRRVIPIGSYIIATEELPAETMDRLFPTNRIASDTCKVVYYYRPSPDRKRVLFGGRVSATETNTAASAPRLFDSMCRIFPDLRGCKIDYSWSGTVAYSFDELAHTGMHNGIHYAMGYCGSGVSMASYLGMRAGQKVLGLAEGQTAFDGLNHPTRPLYTGKPWFLPAAVTYYRWQDNIQRRLASAGKHQNRSTG
jgi:glycine/D-amino acid oxidase-like deaminating enzyme